MPKSRQNRPCALNVPVEWFKCIQGELRKLPPAPASRRQCVLCKCLKPLEREGGDLPIRSPPVPWFPGRNRGALFPANGRLGNGIAIQQGSHSARAVVICLIRHSSNSISPLEHCSRYTSSNRCSFSESTPPRCCSIALQASGIYSRSTKPRK